MTQRVYHNHGAADECTRTCPRFTPPGGHVYDFSMKIRTDARLPELNGMGIANAIVAEVERQTRLRSIEYFELALTPSGPPYFTGTTEVSVEGTATRKGWNSGDRTSRPKYRG